MHPVCTTFGVGHYLHVVQGKGAVSSLKETSSLHILVLILGSLAMPVQLHADVGKKKNYPLIFNIFSAYEIVL
jgi:hypothetical protein